MMPSGRYGPGVTPSLDPDLLRWATGGREATEVRGMRDGGSPWLIRTGGTAVVLRVGTSASRDSMRTEAAALDLAARHGVPAPRLLAADLDAEPPVLLTAVLDGSSAIPPNRPPIRLRALGAVAAALRSLPVEGTTSLPPRDRPIATVDFAALRRDQPSALLTAAEERITGRPVPGEPGLVHGDLWQGNALWQGDRLVGLVDWDCAGVGPAGVDLGSLRCDAAICFGPEAAGDALAGWEDAAGRPAEDVPYWDAVAALSTPPDLGWFPGAIAGQGRPDLVRELLLERRDAFLAAALDRLDQ